MRPIRFTQDSVGNTIIPVDHRAGTTSVIATPSGGGNYTVEFTTVNIFDSSITPEWIGVTDMVGATAQQDREVGTVTALRVTLNSGASVTVDIAQSDVS